MKTYCILLIVYFNIFSVNGYAQQSAYTSKDLGLENSILTPLGALRSGNKDNTIPPWTGGVKQLPHGYQPGDRHPYPFQKDAPLFIISHENYQQYANKLTAGEIALIKNYPDSYKMIVYPTHRTASYPKWVYEAAVENANKAKLVEWGNGIINARITCPFPIPENGLQAIWNHLIFFKNVSSKRISVQAAPTKLGKYTLMKVKETAFVPFAQKYHAINNNYESNIYGYFLQIIQAPVKIAGNGLLVYEYLNQVINPRKAWLYSPGRRRVIRSPNAAYDYPGTASDGLRTIDDWNIFNGATDRYSWKLLGKKEIYIPYNCYTLHSDTLAYKDILTRYHINQKYVRYELHRVWVVEATLKENKHHIYMFRRFYLDEDSWVCVAAEMYDDQGKIWRVSLAHLINYYEVPLMFSTANVYHDLAARRYLATNLDNEEKVSDFLILFNRKHFTPNALIRNTGR
ncbi:MAG: hypothetical protein OMM_00498 [Candidatus Magnetoglobus multicellularis str. Araruama]|uniref:DUF1329 domain-containing protein n=1 Tax=Candidatus Magnetoglobus multicellularis str. Araruama TaxID=890399 RepID=A0A1V1PGV9_9BACT|nr:MAG: hypothetical protein OMM_00498 [Candidatus Magnetoglobus multicellularis str. Araruama]